MPHNLTQRLGRFRELGTLILLILVIVGAGIREPKFFQASNLQSVMLWIPILAVVGLGQLMVIVTRGIDVSVGSMIGLTAMIAGLIYRANPGKNVMFGALAALLAGLALGSLNGVLVAKAKIPPIIVTLGTLSLFRGLTFIVSHSQQIDSNYLPETLTNWSLHGPIKIGSVVVPWILIVALVISAVASWFLGRTRAGRDVYALGSNPEAARLRGLPVGKATFLVYAITGALCGLAGVFYASRFGFVNPASAGQGMELVVIAAVVIGGTNVSGGSGTVLGVLLGATLLGVISVALAVLGIDATWQQMVYGVIILVGIIVDTVVKRSIGGANS